MSMEMTTPKVSVIIPVFNAADFISKTISSLRAQSLRDVEFIFVDDCSADNSASIIESAAKDDPRIRLIRCEKNGGQGAARNRGIEAARGEYCGFIDADDEIGADFYKILYRRAARTKAKIVKGSSVFVFPDGSEKVYMNWCRFWVRYLCHVPLYQLFTLEHWSAIYSREMLISRNIRYGEMRVGQDTVFLLRVTLAAGRSFALAPCARYRYIQRGDSVVHTYNENWFFALFLAAAEKIRYAQENAPGDRYRTRFIAEQIDVLCRDRWQVLASDEKYAPWRDEYLRRLIKIFDLLLDRASIAAEIDARFKDLLALTDPSDPEQISAAREILTKATPKKSAAK